MSGPIETANGLETAWRQLVDDAAAGGRTLTHQLRDLGDGRTITLGWDGASRLLMVPSAEDPDLAPLMCSGLTVHLRTYRVMSAVLQVVEFGCPDRRCWSVFNRLILDVAGLAGLESCADPTIPLARIIADYRAFLARPASLSLEEVTGLFGELWMLDHLLARRKDVIHLWEGPLGGAHDFRNGCHAIEVKTSLRRGARTAIIHGLNQLVAPTGGDLHLVLLQVDTHEKGEGLRIPDLVDRIRGSCPDPGAFDARLARAKWDEAAVQRHGERTFEVRSYEMAVVDGAFPAITPAVIAGRPIVGALCRIEYEVTIPDGVLRPTEAAANIFLS